MQKFDKFAMSLREPLMAAFKDAEKNAAFVAKLPEFEAFLKENMGSAPYLSGTDEPMYIDIHCFPPIERMI